MKNTHLKAIFAVILFSIVTYGGYQAYQQLATTSTQFLLMQNVEALAGGENLGSGYYTNFKSETVWYNSSVSTGATVSEKPGFWVSGTWTSAVCCVNATDKDACRFDGEERVCGERVVRNSRN